jgi:hypothetical protein
MSARTWVVTAGAATLLVVGAGGAIHTRAGLRALVALGVPCPVRSVTAEQVDLARRAGLATLRGSRPAPARPTVAGLRLDATTEAEAGAVLARAHGRCEVQVRGYRHLRCRGVDAAALGLAGPPVSEMWLSFGRAGRLVAVDVYRRGMRPDDERTVWSDAAGRLRAALGEPGLVLGDPAPAALAAAPIGTARVQYRYADYVATVTAAHLPQTGLSVREQYLSARL